MQPAQETFSAAPAGQAEVRPGNGVNRAGTPHVDDDRQAVPTVTTSNTSHAAVAHSESAAPAASDTSVVAPPPHPPRAAEAAPPAPAAPAPAAAVDLDRLLALGRLRPVAREDGGEMRLHVNSESLGQVEVRVVVREDGVQASLMATQDHARHALESHRPSLEAMLGRANLRLEGFSVGLGQNQQGHESERGDAQRTVPGGAPKAAPALAAAPLSEPAVAAGGLNLRV